ncbi:hypothetical protein IV37_GL000156 [Fructilactobacillus fructivorans]|nr:hypothetical protein IV37_GL000156 [Fructilactobacillus fructivorans]
MAIYQELIRQTFGIDSTPYIIAVSKQQEPDKAIFSIPQFMMDTEMDELKEKQQHISNVINGTEKPIACGHCDYCRMNKQLSTVTPIDSIELY